MPQYNYTCEECKHDWEVTQKMNDSKITECPKCHEPKAKRLISGGTSFQLMGSNWAKDNYSGKR